MYPHPLHKRLSSTGVAILNMSNGFQNAEIIVIIIIGSTALWGPWPPQNDEIYFIIVQLQIFQVFLMLYK
jgi:hypothetical protein